MADLDFITDDDADYLDTLFQQTIHFEYLRVDRNHLKDSKEAWIYITVDQDAIISELTCWGIKSTNGVLTWITVIKPQMKYG